MRLIDCKQQVEMGSDTGEGLCWAAWVFLGKESLQMEDEVLAEGIFLCWGKEKRGKEKGKWEREAGNAGEIRAGVLSLCKAVTASDACVFCH